MVSAVYVTLNQVEAPDDQAAYGGTQYGDNGPANGPDPETVVVSGSSTESGRNVWTSGSDTQSGLVPVQLAVSPGPNNSDVIQFTVLGSTPETISVTVPAIGQISTVEFVAGTQTNAAVQWSNLSVVFGSGGATTDTYNTGTGPAVDTQDADNPDAQEELWINSSNTTNDSVTAYGEVQYTVPSGTYPDVNDLFGDVIIYSAL